jgi:hypothetical protein
MGRFGVRLMLFFVHGEQNEPFIRAHSLIR